MTRQLLIALLFISASLPTAAQAEPGDVVIGQTRTLASEILDETRTIKVWLPEDYAGSGKTYPVFYLLDGDMTMRFAKAAATVAEFGGTRTPEMIVIGVENTDRNRDMFPTRNGRGNADDFLTFFRSELIPFVDDAYRTNGFRALTGHSNSALFVSYALLSKPDSFNAYFAISPMLGWREPEMLDLAGQSFTGFPERHTFLYIAYGEHDYDQVVKVVPGFVEILEETKPRALAYKVEVKAGEGHVPYPSYGDALLALFPDFMMQEQDMAGGLEAIDDHYRSLSQRYGFTIETPAGAIIDFGDLMRDQEEYDKAIEVYELALERFPVYAPLHYLLGRTHQAARNLPEAIRSYRKYLEMRPEAESVEARIAELEKTIKTQ